MAVPPPDRPDPARRVPVTLRDGTKIVLRPAVPADRDLLVEGFERLTLLTRSGTPVEAVHGSR